MPSPRSLLASRGGVSSTCSPSPFHARRNSDSNSQSLWPALDKKIQVPSPDVILLLSSTPPQYVGNPLRRLEKDDGTPEPVRHSNRLKNRPTIKYNADGIYLPTPESTPPLAETNISQGRWSQESSSPSTPPTASKRGLLPADTDPSSQAARLSNMSSFLTYLEHANTTARTAIFSAPLAYSHSDSFETSFASLRDSLIHTPSPRRRAQESALTQETAQSRQDSILSYMEASLGLTPCTVPFTQARNTTETKFAPSIVSSVQRHEIQDCRALAGLLSPGLYIGRDEMASLEALTSGPGGERFVFGGAGATSGQIRGDGILVGVWYRVLDGALRITVAGDGINVGKQEEVILVDADASTAVVMLGRTHEVAAFDLAVGTSGALATGAVLFVTGLVPMTRFYTRRELGELVSVWDAQDSR